MLPKSEVQVRHFVAESGIEFSLLANAFGESTKFVMNWWNQPNKLWLSDRQLSNLASFLNLSVDQMLSSKLPIEEMRQRFIQGPKIHQEHYFKNAFSNVRTTAHIVRYLAIRFGRSKVDNLLRAMGVHPCIYSSHDNKISIDFFVDLLEHAKKIGLEHEEICQLGCYMFLGVSGTELGKRFASATNHIECYQVLNSNFHNFDHNFIYQVDLSEEGFEMIIYPGEILAKKIAAGKTNCSTLALYRQYMMCWFPYLSGLTPLEGQLVKSLAYGDDHCILQATFPKFNESKKPLKLLFVQGV